MLKYIANELREKSDYILLENQKDLSLAKEKGITEALLDRLKLNEERIFNISNSVEKVANLPSTLGDIKTMWKRPNGLMIGKMVVPLGVVAIIYEARPNVTVDAAALCIKSGNTVILRGGSEAINSNTALVNVIQNAIEKAGFSKEIVQFIDVTDRKAVDELMKLYQYIDVLIPRGGPSLINYTIENSRIPVIQTGAGNCHVYVDKDADINKALKIVENAKISRPSVCNAVETILVHNDIANEFLKKLYLLLNNKVEFRGCKKTLKILPQIKPATDKDWETEYLDYILAVKIVEDVEEAIKHINTYSSKHSEAIVTENYITIRKFLNEIDAAAVYVNASTRFTDGEEFGYGAEMGISTQKLHVRGPIGIEDLTTYKYVILGNGQVR
jgi:glutamate-5-semialdehyde dehydrogenase